MPAMEQQELNEKLEKFSETLRKRMKEFKETGRFSDLQRPFLADIEQKNAALRARVSDAAQSRKSWTFAKAEL
jgi:siroheme synthase (precorrin-2 oxidase/ferrochelatase)